MNAQLVNKREKISRKKCLSEDVSRLKGTLYITWGNKFGLKGITIKMTINFNMLHALMKNRIGCNVNA